MLKVLLALRIQIGRQLLRRNRGCYSVFRHWNLRGPQDCVQNQLALILITPVLVEVAASDAKPAPRIAPGFDLAGALGNGKLAMADPASVPAGKYGKAALTALGVWNSVASRVVTAENVRVALEYVARGEAPYGIVYATDAKVAPQVKLAGTFPENTHAPIIYPVALTATAVPDARDFLAFLSSTKARAVFEKAGFSLR